MSENLSDFDEFLVLTVLADLFYSTDSDDPGYVAKK